MTAPIPATDAAALALAAPGFVFAVVATRETATGPARVVDSLAHTRRTAVRYAQALPFWPRSPVVYERRGDEWRQTWPREKMR